MILKRLVEYENRHSNQAPVGYANRRVHLKIRLRGDGTLRDAIPFSDGSGKGKLDGLTMLVPNIKRSGTNPPPFLLVDDARYVLGSENSEGYRERFEALVADCAHASGDARVQAVLTWLKSKPVFVHPSGEALTRMHVVGFEVDGDWMPDLPVVREFWARKAGAATASKGIATKAVCLITGELTEPVRILPLKVKGVPKTNQGQADLTSFNNDAFKSYGLDQTQNSPMSAEAARKAVNGLNRLLADEATRLYVGDVVYCFWTREPVEFSVMRWLDNPQPDDVKELLGGAFTGRLAKVKDTLFYSLALSGYTSRIVVRDYVETTLGKTAEKLETWFRRISIIDKDGSEPKPFGIFSLSASLFPLDKNSKRQVLNPNVPTALLRSALTGAPLPDYLLGLAVKRNLAMQGPYSVFNKKRYLAVERLALIKAIVQRKYPMNDLTSLNENLNEPAYLCGRLLAVYDKIQEDYFRIDGKDRPGVTVADKYFGSAAATPRAVLAMVGKHARNHLAKLNRRDKGYFHERRIEALMAEFSGPMPAALALTEQGLFALGFYHQRAETQRDIKAAVDAKAANKSEGESA
jgi:CRISPR-associated protein Csd1